MDLDALPVIDEHAVDVRADAERVCDAVLETFRDSGSRATRVLTAVLGGAPGSTQGWDGESVQGATVPGFAVAQLDRPGLVVLSGRHRFSQYAIVVRIDPTATGSRCRLESRGTFPGPLGAVYRTLVVGTRGHVVAVRSLLTSIRRRAEAGALPAAHS